MRKLLNYLLLITASIILMSGGCSGDDEPVPSPGPSPENPSTDNERLAVSPTTLSFAAEAAEEQTVNVTSPTAAWTAKSDQEWCYTRRMSNTQLVIGVNNTYVTTERSATVTVTAGEQTATVRVTQAGSTARLSVSSNRLQFGFGGGQDSIIYIHCSPTYTDLKYEVKDGGDWLSISPASGEASDYIYVSAAYNHAFSPRAATITITLPETEPQVIDVTQRAGFIIAQGGDDVVTFPYFYYDNYQTFSVITTAEDPENISMRFSDDTWLHFKSDNGHRWDDDMVRYNWYDEQSQQHVPVSFHDFSVFADENGKYQERNASADIYYRDSLIKRVDFLQWPYPRLSVIAQHGTALPTSGGSLDVRVYANYEWKYTEPKYTEEGDPWVSVERIGDSVLRFSCQPNKTDKHRPNCYVNIESYGYSQYVTITEKDGTAGEGYGYGDGTTWDE